MKLDITGKTIARVEQSPTWETMSKPWDDQDCEELILHFTDGTYVRLTATGGAGCRECDFDGSISQYISSYQGKS